jgi:hypothetical protein
MWQQRAGDPLQRTHAPQGVDVVEVG